MIFFITNLKITAILKYKFPILVCIGCLINFYSFAFKDKCKTPAEINKRSTINVAPIFTNTTYSFSVSEQVVVGSSVGQVTATDEDGDALTYSIKKGNTNSAFTINGATGLITVTKLLNHHTQNSYILTVSVTDTQGLFSEAPVSITVIAVATFPTFNNISWGTVAKQFTNTHEVHGDVVNGKLYIFGGYDPKKHALNPPQWTPTKRSFVYNPLTNKWDSIADLPHTPNGPGFGGITHEGLTIDGTDIYFAGGYPSNSTGTGQVFGTKQVWRYNVASNTYTALPGLPIDLATGQLRYLNGKLHYMGGANKFRRDTTVHYVLDLDSLSAGWKVLAPLLNGTNHAGSAVYEGKIYYLGGSHFQDANAIPQKTVEVYDPKTNTWMKLADMSTARDHISSVVIVVGNRILVLGGETTHNIKSDLVSAYSPDSNTWAELTPLPITKSAGVAAFLNNNIHYTGGNFSNTNYKGIPVIQKVDSITLSPVVDAYVRNGSYANNNYGSISTLVIKGSPTSGFNRKSYLKFSLNSVNSVSSAKLRLYGSNTTDNTTVNISTYGVGDDSWTENEITWNNAPAASTSVISSVGVSASAAYYELDVTNFVTTQLAGDKIVSFLINDPANKDKNVVFNSKENVQNPPQLIIAYTATNTTAVLNPTNDLSQQTLYSSLLRTKIYPNPVHNQLNIELPNNSKGFINFKIVDPLGRIYDLGKIKSATRGNNIEVDISKLFLSKGIYYLQLSTDTKKGETIKFIIE